MNVEIMNGRYDADDQNKNFSLFPPDRHVETTEGYKRHVTRMDNSTSEVLNNITNQSIRSLQVAACAAVVYLLYRYTEEAELCIGLIDGDSSFPVSCKVERDVTYKEMIFQVRDNILKPYVESKLAYSILVEATEEAELIRQVEQEDYRIKFMFVKKEKEIELVITYSSDWYSHTYISRIAENFVYLMQQSASNYDVKMSDLEIVSSEERQVILNTFNDTTARFDENMTLVQLFERQVKVNAQRTAVVYNGESMTYMELDARVKQLAHLLHRKGIVSGDIIGLMLPRSLNMIISVLAVLRAGAAYMPIDPNLPDERVRYMVTDSHAQLTLTSADLVQRLNGIVRIECVDDCFKRPLSITAHATITEVNAHDLAYIIYTSGTTGNPKGVQISHRNVVRLLFNDQARFNFNEQDVWTMFHSFSFDFSVWEIYGALLNGGKLVIVPEDITREPAEFINLLLSEKVTILNQTPTFFYRLLNYIVNETNQDLSLRYVIFGGEALNPSLIKSFMDTSPHVKFINMYGITETTVHVTSKVLDAEAIKSNVSNIGVPLPTLQVYVLDQNDKLCPVQVVGELFVSGEGVSVGYLNRPELTAESFLPDPFQPGKRMYRTGDLVKWLPTGELQYIGRKDLQVKIRGYRIELGEIEQALATYEAIRDAAVVAKEDKVGDKLLYCYYVSAAKVERLELKHYLQTQVPSYMIPSYFIEVDKLPLTNNGKVDRRQLLAIDVEESSGDNVYEVTYNDDVLYKLENIWREILQLKKVRLEASFFDCGGDSIRVIGLVTLINKSFGCRIGVKDVYRNHRFAELANFLREKQVELKTEKIDIPQNADAYNEVDWNLSANLPANFVEYYPMSTIQQSMVYYSLLKKDEAIYHDQFVFPVDVVEFKFETLKDVVLKLLDKHEILRTTFNVKDQMQLVHRHILPVISFDNITDLKLEQQQQIIESFLQEDLNLKYCFTGLELLWRMKVYQLSAGKVIIILSCHHAILDGWSIASLYAELMEKYNEMHLKGEITLRRLKSTYKDYVLGSYSDLNRRETEAFWMRYMDGYSRNKLPFNYFGRPIRGKQGRTIKEFSLGSELYDRVVQFGAANECSVQEVCLGAYLYLLRVISTEKDVVTGVVTHNRPAVEDGEKLLGCFLNTVPIRTTVDKSLNKQSFLRSIRSTLTEMKSNELFLADIASLLGESGNGQENPVFDTLFNFMDFHVLGSLYDNAAMRRSTVEFELTRNEMTNTLFDFEILKTPNYFGMQIKYAPAYFYDEDIDKAAALYEKILAEFIDQESGNIKYSKLLLQSEIAELLKERNGPVISYDNQSTLHQLIERQASRTPYATAIICAGKKLMYVELNDRANKLARLLQSRDVGCGDKVGICLERNEQLIVALLAVLKIGAAYVPMEPDYPLARKQHIIEDADVKYLISKEAIGDLPFTNENESEISSYPAINLDIPVAADQLAYVIYTSGSTGRPKGVMIEHHSVINLINWVNRTFTVNNRDVLLFVTSVCFDLSVYDIFGMLSAGGQVVIATKEESRDVLRVKQMLTEHRITFWDSTPSTLNQIIQLAEEDETEGQQHYLRLVFLSGDWVPVKLPRRAQMYFPNAEVVCLGGATECTIWSNYYKVSMEMVYTGSIPYGKPIDNSSFFILDNDKELVPTGVPGELYIGGVGVGRGYYGDAAKTNEAFLPNHILNGMGRIYKTGDMGRYLPNGEIEFLGRRDNQVKIRGFRVEIGEVENVISKYEGITDVVVVDQMDETGVKYLCAYYAHRKDITRDLREFLLEHLPNYMIPSFLIRLDKLPLTSNGKVDRANLPLPSLSEKVASPRSEHSETKVQQKIKEIWKSTLKVDDVQLTDNFFLDLGGHSLSATTVMNRIHKEFDVELELKDIFRDPTIQKLSLVVEGLLRRSKV
ncbi:Gramicidin S synthetase II [Paenibacillus sp. FSL H7-689]|nr:Gramicidin S synthetase II [Paenibacillus sp. FSL H7-689]